VSVVSLVSAVSHESSPVLQGMLHGRLIITGSRLVAYQRRKKALLSREAKG